MSFGEDRCRARKGHAAQNVASLRRMAMNLLRRETTSKRGLKGKRLLAALDNDCLLAVLSVGP